MEVEVEVEVNGKEQLRCGRMLLGDVVFSTLAT